MFKKIKPFSANIQGHIETYDDSLSFPDTFQISPVTRRKLYQQWTLLMTGAGLEPGYKRVKGVLKAESKEVDEAADKLFAGKTITKKEENILKIGWPKLFKDVFCENLSKENFQDPETAKKAKEFHWVQWEKAIPRDERGKIDPRMLDKEKRAFEEYWRNLLQIMKKLWIPGKSWGVKFGEYYHRDVGYY